MKDNLAIGVDVGGSHISSAIVDIDEGSFLSEINTDPIDKEASAEKIISGWCDNINKTALSLKNGSKVRVSLAMPGPFDYDKGFSLITGVRKFDSLFGMNVGASMFPRLRKINEIRFVNDAAAYALGECWWGEARNYRKVIVLTLGTGVGSCFIDDHRVLTEGPGVPENGYVYNLPFEGGMVNDEFSTNWIVRKYEEMTGVKVSGALDVASNYDHDLAARQIFDEYGKRLAKFIVSLTSEFKADAVLLGGNIAKNHVYFGKALDNSLSKNNSNAKILISKLYDKAAILGAASIFIQK